MPRASPCVSSRAPSARSPGRAPSAFAGTHPRGGTGLGHTRVRRSRRAKANSRRPGSGRGAAGCDSRAPFVGDPQRELPRTSVAAIPELTTTEAAAGTRIVPGIAERCRLRRPPDGSQDPEGSRVRETVVHPRHGTIDGARDRPAERRARQRATLTGRGVQAEPVKDLDRPAAGIEDTCVERRFCPDTPAVDVAASRGGGCRGGADQDETDGDGGDAHGRTMSGPGVPRNRRKAVTTAAALAVASRANPTPAR